MALSKKSNHVIRQEIRNQAFEMVCGQYGLNKSAATAWKDQLSHGSPDVAEAIRAQLPNATRGHFSDTARNSSPYVQAALRDARAGGPSNIVGDALRNEQNHDLIRNTLETANHGLALDRYNRHPPAPHQYDPRGAPIDSAPHIMAGQRNPMDRDAHISYGARPPPNILERAADPRMSLLGLKDWQKGQMQKSRPLPLP